MISNREPNMATLLFLAVFSAWFVADRYAGVSLFYALNVLIFCTFVAVIALAIFRSWRLRAVEWRTLGAAAAMLLAAELTWRLIVAPLPMNGFKIAALVMGLGSPIVLLLGVIALLSAWRSPGQEWQRRDRS